MPGAGHRRRGGIGEEALAARRGGFVPVASVRSDQPEAKHPDCIRTRAPNFQGSAIRPAPAPSSGAAGPGVPDVPDRIRHARRMLNGGRHRCRPPLHHRLPVRCGTSGDWHGARPKPKASVCAKAFSRLTAGRSPLRPATEWSVPEVAGTSPLESGEAWPVPVLASRLDGRLEPRPAALCASAPEGAMRIPALGQISGDHVAALAINPFRSTQVPDFSRASVSL